MKKTDKVMRCRIWKQELYWAFDLFLTVIFNICSAADYCLDLLNNYIFLCKNYDTTEDAK